jgi:hypothetical protein
MTVNNNNRPIIIAVDVDGNSFSVILKQNDMYSRFQSNFKNLAKEKLFPALKGPDSMDVKKFVDSSKEENLKITFSYSSERNIDWKNESPVFANAVMGFIMEFTEKAIRQMLDSSEFVPLSGYSFSKLKEESKRALTERRKLILIKTFDQYEKMGTVENENKYKFDIKILDPEKDRTEYANVYLILQNEDPKAAQKELTKKYLSELKYTDWNNWL